MDISESLNKENILINGEDKNKQEVLKSLVHSLYETGNILDESKFLSAVYAREAEGVTGIGNGVAIPHGKSDSVTAPAVAIATLHEPIEWESLDDEKIKIVVLFAVSDTVEDSKEHLRLLSEFAKLLGTDQLLKALKDAKDVKDVTNAFKKERLL